MVAYSLPFLYLSIDISHFNMKQSILGIILILQSITYCFSQSSSQKVEKVNDNFYSFLCKNVFGRSKQKDSVISDLNCPLKRVYFYLLLNDQFYLGSFDEFELYLGISPSNSLDNLYKYAQSSAEQKEKMKNIIAIKEINKNLIIKNAICKKLQKTEIEDNDFKTKTSFIKCPLPKCLNENLNVELFGYDIHKYPWDTSEVIFNKNGLVKKQIKCDLNIKNYSNVYTLAIPTLDSSAAVNVVSVDTLAIATSDSSSVVNVVSIDKANLVSSHIINNYYKVKFKFDEDSVIGWICTCAVKPEPYYIKYDSLESVNINYLTSSDELYTEYDFKRQMRNFNWYKNCFPEKYSVNHHVMTILSYSNGLKPKESIPLIEYAATLEPSNERIYTLLGNSKFEIGDFFGSIQAYTKSIEINPKIENTYEKRGESKQKLKDLRGALLDFEKVLETNQMMQKRIILSLILNMTWVIITLQSIITRNV